MSSFPRCVRWWPLLCGWASYRKYCKPPSPEKSFDMLWCAIISSTRSQPTCFPTNETAPRGGEKSRKAKTIRFKKWPGSRIPTWQDNNQGNGETPCHVGTPRLVTWPCHCHPIPSHHRITHNAIHILPFIAPGACPPSDRGDRPSGIALGDRCPSHRGRAIAKGTGGGLNSVAPPRDPTVADFGSGRRTDCGAYRNSNLGCGFFFPIRVKGRKGSARQKQGLKVLG